MYMIKEGKVIVGINYKNRDHYLNLGYVVDGNKLEVDTKDINITSKARIVAICELCDSENSISASKYYVNKNRNGKGYYSCFSCKDVEKKKTCLEKYGKESYSQTDEFKEFASEKFKGQRNGGEKYINTMLERYGVTCYFQTDIMKQRNREWMSSEEFKSKSKEAMIEKYGVDHFSKTDLFKDIITSKKDIINEKIKSTFLEKYGFEYYSQTEMWKESFKRKLSATIRTIKKTCMKRYGVDNVSKVGHINRKSINTKIKRGLATPRHLLSEWDIYKRTVKSFTNKVKKCLYDGWDGIDFYDGEKIEKYFEYHHLHRFYPTIDHKISLSYGFKNGISPEEISDIDNLCITKRYINCMKNSMISSKFIKKIKEGN